MKKVYILLAFISVATFAFAKNNGESGETEKKVAKKPIAEPMLSGTVLDAETKKPLTEVTITIKSPGKADQSVTTDCAGNFKMPQLAQGTYTLKFDKVNYQSAEKTNVAVRTTTVKINFELWQQEDEDRQSLWDKHGFFKR